MAVTGRRYEETAGGIRESASWSPEASLRPFVQDYQGYAEGQPSRRLEVPHPGVVVILNTGAPLAVVDQLRTKEPVQVRHSFVAGLHDRPVITESAGDSSGIQLNFTAIGAYLFFGGRPMHEVANGAFSLDEVLGREATTLVEQVDEAGSWEARFSLIDTFIAGRLRRARLPDEGVVWAWNQLLRSGGNTPVGGLAERLGWSRKRLADCFRDGVGLTPKTFAQVVRFERAASRLEQSGPGELSGVATDCGYYDQAHFSREFSRFAGMTPGAYRSLVQSPEGNLLTN